MDLVIQLLTYVFVGCLSICFYKLANKLTDKYKKRKTGDK